MASKTSTEKVLKMLRTWRYSLYEISEATGVPLEQVKKIFMEAMGNGK